MNKVFEQEIWDCDILKRGEIVGGWEVAYFIARGGFGAVYGVREISSQRLGALKIYSGVVKADSMRGQESIKDEAVLLSSLSTACAPQLYCKGKHKGRAFFIMELVEPLSIETLPTTEVEIRRLVLGVILAVKALHHLGERGWVHRDIKPENIARRPRNGQIVLIDYGAAHEMDEEGVREHQPRENTHNIRRGKYASVGTRGYAPPELLFRPCCDVFAIGRVIRDCFEKEVPIVWSLIINKCISNNPDYRYETIEELEQDVLNIQVIGRDEIRRIVYGDRVNAVRLQASLVKAKLVKMTWIDLKSTLARSQEKDGTVYAGECQVFIDFDMLRSQHLSISGHVKLQRDRFIVVKGPGVLDINLDAFLADEYGEDLNDKNGLTAVVVLLNNATVINRTNKPLAAQHIRYLIGDSCYLNFPNLSSRPEEEPDYIVTSNLGYSYVSYGANKETLLSFLRQKDKDIEDSIPLIYSYSNREVFFDRETGQCNGFDVNSVRYHLLENDIYRQTFGMLKKCTPLE